MSQVEALRKLIEIVTQSEARINAWATYYNGAMRQAERDAEQAMVDYMKSVSGRITSRVIASRAQTSASVARAMRYDTIAQGMLSAIEEYVVLAYTLGFEGQREHILEKLNKAKKNYEIKEAMSAEDFFKMMSDAEGLRINQSLVKFFIREIEEWMNKTKDSLSETIARTIIDGAERGLSIDEVRDNIMDRVGDSERARMIARTEMNRALNAGAMEAMSQVDIEQVEWVENPDACPVCAENGSADNAVRDIGKEYPSGHTQPPAHPNCRCAIVAAFDF